MAIELDGIDDKVIVSDNDSLDVTSALTVAGWVYWDTLINESVIVGKWGASGNNRSWNFRIFSTGAIKINITSTGILSTIQASDTGVISTGAWFHVAFTYENLATGRTIFYVNGVAVGTVDTFSGNIHVGTADVVFGYIDNGTGSFHFNGRMDEFGMWKVALTGDDIAQLYNSRIKHMPLQTQPANLVMYSSMDDGADGTSADGQTFRDLSGNGNDGIGDNGANNTGLTWEAEEILSYSPYIISPTSDLVIVEGEIFNAKSYITCELSKESTITQEAILESVIK